MNGSDELYITDFLALKNHLIVMSRAKGLDQVEIHDSKTRKHHQIEFPDAAYTVGFGTNPKSDATFVRLEYSSMTSPSKILDYDVITRSTVTKKTQKIPSGYSEENYVSERILADAERTISHLHRTYGAKPRRFTIRRMLHHSIKHYEGAMRMPLLSQRLDEGTGPATCGALASAVISEITDITAESALSLEDGIFELKARTYTNLECTYANFKRTYTNLESTAVSRGRDLRAQGAT